MSVLTLSRPYTADSKIIIIIVIVSLWIWKRRIRSIGMVVAHAKTGVRGNFFKAGQSFSIDGKTSARVGISERVVHG